MAHEERNMEKSKRTSGQTNIDVFEQANSLGKYTAAELINIFWLSNRGRCDVAVAQHNKEQRIVDYRQKNFS
jgi:hypothetical protein